MRATDKNPPMTAEDFYRAGRERYHEAEFLYNEQIRNPGQELWNVINFLSVVAAECIFTWQLLCKNPNAILVTNHDIDVLAKQTDLINIQGIGKATGDIWNYWKHWHKDLRYLDKQYFIERVKTETIVDPKFYPEAPEIIGKTVYSAATTIIKVGEQEWKKQNAT
jgi:hypothetical protein